MNARYRFFGRLLAISELIAVFFITKLFGISIIKRYLTNPNPYITTTILRAFGARIGKNTTIKGSILVDNLYEDRNSSGDFSHLMIGNNCYIGEGVYFDLASKIIIEDNSVISAGAAFITHEDCNRSPILSEVFPRKCQDIRVGQGAWIGFRAILLCGAEVGDNAMIAANSLLRGKADAYSLYAGVPARKIRTFDQIVPEQPHRH